MDTKSSGMKYSKYWKENKPSVDNLIFSKTSFKNEGEINTFLNKQKVRDLLLAHSAYIGSMRQVLHIERIWHQTLIQIDMKKLKAPFQVIIYLMEMFISLNFFS